MKKFKLNINGKQIKVEAHPFARLLDVIREQVGLTGTKEGCGEGECGACSVLVDGELVNSCLIPIVQAEGVKIRTIEGVADKTKLSKIQEAFINNNGAQCGICTPGMVLASINLLSKNKKPNQLEIKEALAGNLCRCTGYMKIFDAIRDTMNSGGKSK